MMQAAIVGGSGFTGGELLRLLHGHPQVDITQITSRSQAGNYVYHVHPHMRGQTRLQFVHPEKLQPCDVLFLAVPHGHSSRHIQHYADLAPRIIDLSADFRLDSAEAYQQWYGEPHPAPEWLARFVYGLPERNRDALRETQYASGVGCNATVLNLALWPLINADWTERIRAELKVGSSEGGNSPNAGSHHPVRSGAVRSYAANGHRHMAEVQMMLGDDVPLRFSVTAIEMIRGVHLLAHVDLNQQVRERDIWKLYRSACNDEPFIRIVAGKSGLHRLPEPRIVAGTNYCDIGFDLADDGRHLVVIAALDNLVKGAAGSAVQSLNLMCGFDECAGLGFTGLYP